MKRTIAILRKGTQTKGLYSLKHITMKNKNITLSEIGLFLSCILMIAALLYIRAN
ncbi:hypothetical protein FLAVO9AF_920024 [Flavobacterium sp. 9AF]|uniref:hypothetical protein n=1 Tax=Flavobacterium sp. 9AF TaxID=2653142 RepID=UPI0012F27A10|nr:hypothetical protein [Flavobacterium sp. 9AF]VXC39420.1 hypothetical protein FLAVO9AF_920024 [Flavobacterium sp. 9AF]